MEFKDKAISIHGSPLISSEIRILQVNLGYKCNMSCKHCHINAGPRRNEEMCKETIDMVLKVLRENDIKTLDITGGAPELNHNFKYDPDKASFGQKIKYVLAKTIYGEYPPHSSLNYIWANRKDEKGIVRNPYADEAKMVILEAGPDRIGQWQEEDVNIIDDYRKAFGTDPPAIAGIAVMNDSDNTGESSVSYIEYIEVYK